MRLGRLVTAVTLLITLGLIGGIGPTAMAQTAPPPGAISDNVEFIANITEMRQAIAINFIGNTMFVSTVHGVYSYDITNPATPTLLGALPMFIWENEDMSVDPVRKRLYISRDPRGFITPAGGGGNFPYGALHIIDVSNPAAMIELNFFLLDAGHTSTCINNCDFMWTGGPGKHATQPADWTGRPIFGTDVRDPLNPVKCPKPIDLYRNDGVTAYAHDVQVDADGIAWVSGAGGVRGYWTSGMHTNPISSMKRVLYQASPCNPIPYAGGGTPNTATPSRFMHNAWRNVNATIPGEDDPNQPGDQTKGMVLYGTEENITANCNSSGRFATYDLRGSFNGEGWKSTSVATFRMRVLDTWTPQAQPGSTGCVSAHYFADRGDSMLAYGFYGQGTRFLDVSDPKDIRQVGYFRPNGASTWAAYWHNGYVFIADNSRGVDIVRFTGQAGDAAVEAPIVDQVVQVPMAAESGYMCPFDGSFLTVG